LKNEYRRIIKISMNENQDDQSKKPRKVPFISPLAIAQEGILKRITSQGIYKGQNKTNIFSSSFPLISNSFETIQQQVSFNFRPCNLAVQYAAVSLRTRCTNTYIYASSSKEPDHLSSRD